MEPLVIVCIIIITILFLISWRLMKNSANREKQEKIAFEHYLEKRENKEPVTTHEESSLVPKKLTTVQLPIHKFKYRKEFVAGYYDFMSEEDMFKWTCEDLIQQIYQSGAYEFVVEKRPDQSVEFFITVTVLSPTKGENNASLL